MNDNTTRLLEAVGKLIAERPAASEHRPEDETLPEPISADTLARIKEDASKLSDHAYFAPLHRA